ncbi:TPA: hypothetical protein DCX15_04755 [bacterium]|nr:hypothetical protein [bacterium]
MKRKDLIFLLIIGGMVILFFSRAIFSNDTFVYRDFFRYFYPTRYFAWESIRNGIIPLWNPYLYCGIPFLADLQSCIFYPPSIILYLLPFHLGLKFFVIGHYFLAGLFMYLLLKDFELSRSACLVGAITFIFSGYLLSVVDMLTSLTSATWIPLVFFFFNRTLREGRREEGGGRGFWYAILTGIALGMQFLGGEPTLLYATLLSLFFFAIAKGLSGVRNQESGVRSLFKRLSTLHSLLSTLYSLLVTCVIALGLVLFQALPFLEMVINSTRWGGLTYQEASNWPLHPYETIGLLIPLFWREGGDNPLFFPFGQFWLKSVYLGIIPIMLGLIAIIYARRKAVCFFAILFLCFIILSLGDYVPGYQFLYRQFPFFSLIRYPIKFYSLAVFSSSVLAGFGFSHLSGGVGVKRKALRLFLPMNLFLFLIWAVIYFNKTGWYSLIFKVFGLTGPERILTIVDQFEDIFGNFSMVLLFFALGSFVLFWGSLREGRSIYPLIGILCIDLFYFGVGLNPVIPQSLYQHDSGSLRFIKKDKDKDIFRTALSPKTEFYCRSMREPTPVLVLKGAKEFLMPNLGLPHHLFDAYGYGSLTLNDYTKLYTYINTNPYEEVGHLVDLLNVKYIISKREWELTLEDLELVYDDEVKIYRNNSVLPRTFLVPRATICTEEELVERFTDPSFDPRREVLLEEEKGKRKRRGEGRGEKGIGVENRPLSTSKIVEYRPNKVVIQTSSQEPSFLFLSDTYYPGWKAYVDGVETEVYRANYTFRAIELPAGEHLVEFVYRPTSFKVGVLGSGLALMSLLGYGLIKRRITC